MPSAIVGHDAEFDHAWRCLEGAEALLLNGPAAIGKTVLWRALVAEAQSAGWLVLACAPNEPEVDPSFAGAKKILDVDRELGHDIKALNGIGDEAYLEDGSVFVGKSGVGGDSPGTP
jgi:hypothetical protein